MDYYLTIDIGGTDIKYGIINNDETLVFKSVRPTDAHLGGANIITIIEDIFNEIKYKYDIKGISISSTGGISDDTQVLTPSININNYEQVNFKRDLFHLNLNVSAENDVNSMGLCEFSLIPDYKEKKALVALTIGTGIGGSIMINGKLHRGNAFIGGEIGKMKTSKDKTYEELASTTALVNNSKKIYPEIKNGVDVFKLYDQGDILIKDVVQEFYDNLALGIANIIYILNPDHIVIGGGVTNRGDQFLDELKLVLKEHVWEYLQDKFTISLAKTKNDAGMIGAFKKYKELYL